MCMYVQIKIAHMKCAYVFVFVYVHAYAYVYENFIKAWTWICLDTNITAFFSTVWKVGWLRHTCTGRMRWWGLWKFLECSTHVRCWDETCLRVSVPCRWTKFPWLLQHVVFDNIFESTQKWSAVFRRSTGAATMFISSFHMYLYLYLYYCM